MGALLAGSTAVAIGGCGSGGFRIDHTVVENAIQVSLARQRHELAIVTCPVGVVAKQGGRFTCTVTFASGDQAPISVTELDNRGDLHYSGLNGSGSGHTVR